VLLNNDTVVLPDALERCARYLDAHPDVGVVGPQLLNPDGSKQNSIHSVPNFVTEVLPKGLLEQIAPLRYPSKRFEHPAPIAVEAVLGACMLVRREVLDDVGLMPEDYFFFLEETDWCLQIRRAGWKVVHVPEARVIHDVHGATTKKRVPAETRIEYHRSLYRFFRKNRGERAFRTLLALRVAKGFFYAATGWLPGLVSSLAAEPARARLAPARAPRARGAGAGGGRRGAGARAVKVLVTGGAGFVGSGARTTPHRSK
jgi:GT2 family glycosyltransferase